MRENPSVRVRVPATTANLGAGFDCLGMALDIWNEVDFCLSGKSLSIITFGEGENILPTDGTNLIYQVMLKFAQSHRKDLPKGILIQCKNQIPVASGLGSSSAAIITGCLAASKLLKIQMDKDILFKLAASIEGHADNIGACLNGGLVITTQSEGELITRKISVPIIKAIIALPDIILSTEEARKILPGKVRLDQAVFNISRASLLVYAFQNNQLDILRAAMQDQIHQSHRLKRIPGGEKAISAAISAGAQGAALSGAGPSIIAFTQDHSEAVGQAMQAAFRSNGISVRIIYAHPSNSGAIIL